VNNVVAVVRPDDGGVADALRALGCDVTVCPDADSGMAASLVHALRHSLPADGWLIALGDMPFVQASTLIALRDALTGGAGIAVPTCEGRRGNPVGFSASYLQDLLALKGDQGARAIIATGVVTELAVQDPGIFSDIDTRPDLLKASTLP
jgi:molybdenum cofactor cytidylyltransferase